MDDIKIDSMLRLRKKTDELPVSKNDKLDAFFRRSFDLVGAILGLLFFSPFLVFIAILIKRDSPGPVLFKGLRMGKGGKEFKILKFRTMYENPESYSGPKVTGQGDTRITPVGNWLRDTKINELPQLLNVLKGEMSLVGPRPEDPDIARMWPEEAKRELFAVKPGITSPASVLYRNEESMLQTGNVMEDYLKEVVPSKIRLDRIYVRERTFLTDLDVVFWTLIILIPAARKQAIPENRLYWGPLSNFFTHDVRWFFVDLSIAILSVVAVGLTWRTIQPLHIGWTWGFAIALLMAVVFSLSNSLFGSNRIYWAKARASDALELLLSTGLGVGALLLFNQFLMVKPSFPVGLFLLGGAVAFFGFVSARYQERILTGIATRWLKYRGPNVSLGEKIIIIGAGDLGHFATWLVRRGSTAQAFTIVGMVDDDPKKQGMRVDGVKVLGQTKDLVDLVKSHDIGLLMFAISNITAGEKQRILKLCERIDTKFVLIPNVIKIMRDNFRKQSGQSSDFIAPTLFDKFGRTYLDNWADDMDVYLEKGDLESARVMLAELRQRQIEGGLEEIVNDEYLVQ